MSKEEKKTDQPQAKTQSAPMGPVAGQTGMFYPGFPDINPMYPPMPGTQPGFCPGMPGMPPTPGVVLAQAYIPIQPCDSPQFDLRRALEAGTLYPDLYRPYPHK